MNRFIHALWIVIASSLLFACGGSTPKQEVTAATLPPPVARTIHYRTDVQPIFDDKCAACHACNDAPCQLKLTSWEGTDRGATKLKVYDGTREKNQAPTRLGIDALRTSDWRERGFFSVQHPPKEKDGVTALQSSLLARMIDLGHEHAWTANQKIPDDIDLGRERENACPTLKEFDDYAEDRPLQGMPLAVTGLSDQEMQTLRTWVAEGSVVEPSLLKPSERERDAIQRWEQYLNRDGAREQLVARYLYEHLFIAHVHFLEEPKPHFFELVRSHTPPGQDLLPVASVSPNDDPGGPVFYRFRLITDTLVEKTHITYALSDARRKRFDALFFGQSWEPGIAPGYSDAERANAFATFAAIPAKARYQFMLDNAEYFVRSFIRGPVCAGQIATDVIRDQFWVAFEDPATERYVNDEGYRTTVTPLIGVPGQDSDLIDTVANWNEYRDQRNRYMALRQAQYAKREPTGPSLEDLWDGDGHNQDALLTIFRHHDSAAVRRGLHGALPETLWVMDYPLLERSYYQLVVNFNVFGNVSHQLQTRLYFDLIRNEGEYNFLRFLPPKAREKLRSTWYAGGGKLKLFTTYAAADDATPTAIPFRTKDAKAEFADQLIARMRRVLGAPDTINRCDAKNCADDKGVQAHVALANQTLRRFGGVTAATMPVIARLPELVYLRITSPGQDNLVYGLVHNRAHTNVAFLLGEEERLEPEKDTLSIVAGAIGSYPNFIFDVPLADLPAFVDALSAVRDDAELEGVVVRWGVRRTRPDFWTVFHDLTRYLERTEPVEAGLFDMSRYVNL